MTTNPSKEPFQPDFNPEDGAIFKNVIFELDSNISSSEQSTLKEQLLKYGAKCYDDEKNVSSIEHPTIISLIATKLLMLPILSRLFGPKFYTPDPSKHFSGIVVATSGIPTRDQEAIFGATLALGGQYRENLTSDVTHLVCLAPEGDMYDEAMGPLFGKIKVILPHWFDECFKLRRLVPEDAFLFPDPLFSQQQATSNQPSESNTSTAVSSPNKQTDDTKIQQDIDQEDMGLSRSSSTTSTTNMEIDTISTSTTKDKDGAISDKSATDDGPKVYALPTAETLATLVPKDRFFDGKLIYIHSDVGLTPEIRKYLLQHLETAGATVTNNFGDTKNHDSVIAIFKYRNSDLFLQVCNRPDVVVANLAWITNTLRRGRVESPLRSICDYPAPYGGIVGMKNLTATISGYKGDARNILFQICTMVGLPCSFTLDHNTTHLICSQRGTAKYCVGRKRNCNIVNHLWLEECYQQWEFKSVADERYTYFPPNDILQTIVGKTPLTLDNLKPWFSKDTWPPVSPYTPIHLLHRSSSRQQDTSSHTTGLARRPRQAALDATSQLRDVYVPDMNDYQKEQRLAGSSHHSPTNVSTDSTGKRQHRPSGSSPSSPSAPSAKRFKVDSMKSKSASTKQTTPPPSSPEKPMSKSPSTTSIQQSPKKSSAPSSTEESQLASELTGDEETEDTTPSPSSKQKSPPSSPFIFVDKPAKIATTSYTLTKDEEKGVRKLGSAVVDDIRKAEILIVPDRILRTPKFLCAVNLGKTIVGSQWIKDSIANQEWSDPSAYQIKDTDMETTYSFDLLDSLVSAQKAVKGNSIGKSGNRHGDWLQGYEVCVLPTAGSAQALKDVVETAGGKLVPVPKRRSKGPSQGNTQGSVDTHQLLALADKKDQKRKGWDDLLDQGVNIYDKELIIVGALRQKVSLDEFSLG
ncbi:unnamed protein product [Absidia cylindrospora]